LVDGGDGDKDCLLPQWSNSLAHSACASCKRSGARCQNDGRSGPRFWFYGSDPSRTGEPAPPGSAPPRWSLNGPIGVAFRS
jgi:hypothetical protein